MDKKYFRFHIVARILLALVIGHAALYIVFYTEVWLISVWLGLAFIILVTNLIKYIQKTHNEMHQFLLTIHEEDFTNTYKYSKKTDLNYGFYLLNEKFKKLKHDKASNYIYLKNLLDHVPVAVISFNKDWHAVLSNPAAKSLFQKDLLTDIHDLREISQELFDTVKNLRTGENRLLKLMVNQAEHQIALRFTAFKLQGEEYKLVSFQDIKNELELNEFMAWNKLLRVLTHEIKNSVIPISTLSEVLVQMMENNEEASGDNEHWQDIKEGILTIEQRSKGLSAFVSSYDKLTRIPAPEKSIFDLKERITKTAALFKNDLDIEIQLDLNLQVTTDASILDQAMVNILKNSVDALKEVTKAKVIILARKRAHRLELVLEDNGPGIPIEIQNQIFVPFYTTKSSGSGIGLSLSKQLMNRLGGDLELDRNYVNGARFILSLPLLTDNQPN